jgi:hypothetical protein
VGYSTPKCHFDGLFIKTTPGTISFWPRVPRKQFEAKKEKKRKFEDKSMHFFVIMQD